MPITSLANKLIQLCLICGFTVLAICSRAEAYVSPSVAKTSEGVLVFLTDRTGVQIRKAASESETPKVHSSIRQDARLKRLTRNATDVLVVGQRSVVLGGRQLIVAAFARPSTAAQGLGYCGAGTEDTLALLEWHPKKNLLVLKDSLLLQSCLQNVMPLSDKGSDLSSVLDDASDPTSIRMAWIDHPKYGSTPQIIGIRNGTLFVSPR